MASAGVASSPGGQLIRIITTALLWWVVCCILVVHACVQMHLAAQRDKMSACALCCGLYFVRLLVILIVLSKSLCVVAISRRFWHPRQVVTGCFCLSFQVSKAAWQEKRFQDYNERCTFHHRARVRPPFFFLPDTDTVALALMSRTVCYISIHFIWSWETGFRSRQGCLVVSPLMWHKGQFSACFLLPSLLWRLNT